MDIRKEGKISESAEIKAILSDAKVQNALEQSSQKTSKKTAGRTKTVIATSCIIVVLALYLLYNGYFKLSSESESTVKKVVGITLACSVILFLNYILKRTIGKKIRDRSSRYNFTKVLNFATIAIIGLIALTLLFANWYATAVSFGVVSLVVGLALQNTFISFFGWIYLLVRKPYEVGDRIKIGSVYGDVMRVGYLDTTLWEFRGDYLSGDHPSGRIIKFANAKVFSEYIYNYSWPLFPFIWNELKLFITYKSDFNFVVERIRQLAESEVGEAMTRRVKRYKTILAESLVEEIDVREHPSVFLRAHENTWVEVTLRFLVEPKNSDRMKTKLFMAIMEELKQFPDKVIFPNMTAPP